MNNTYNHSSKAFADETLNHILAVISEGVWDWNANTGTVIRSPSWYQMLGYDFKSLKQDVFTWENIIHPQDYPNVMEHFELYTQDKIDKYEIEYRCKKADGSYLWILDHAQVVSRNDDGSIARIIGAHKSIHTQKIAEADLQKKNQLLRSGGIKLETIIRQKTAELEEKNKELEQKIIQIERMSDIDPLTKIANRKKFEFELHKEVLRSNRYHHPLSLVIFDVDLFKEINDRHGHKVGDTVLFTISSLVSQNIREGDLLARWGGDEFVVILPNLTEQEAHLTCEKLRLKLNTDKTLKELSVTCSFGVSQYRLGETIDALFQKVDTMLFHSKEHGRNQVRS